MITRLLDIVRQRLARWARARITQIHQIRGFRVVVENSRVDIQTADVLARLDEALRLIEDYQPWRLAHLRRDICQIWITRYPCRGAYFHEQRTCMTELTFLARRDISAAPVAASIIHEGMHARMHRFGVRLDQASGARMERICRRAELHFGRSLPADMGIPVLERASELLELEDDEVSPSIDWREAMRRQRAIDLAAVGRSIRGAV
jgi:hypothetical protein